MTGSRTGAGGLLSRVRARLSRPSADMYLRLERVDMLLDALVQIRDNSQISLGAVTALEQKIQHIGDLFGPDGELRSALSAVPADAQSALAHRVALCEQRLDYLTALASAQSRHTATFATAGAFEIQRNCLEVLRQLRPYSVDGFRKARFGSPNDGGYVLIDDFADIGAAFSFGVEQNADWDVEIADRGVPVYQFDHTIGAPPVIRPDLVFTSARIVAQPSPGGQTIDALVRRHGTAGKASLILKIDIEGEEWAVFDAADPGTLSCFAQIVGEFHSFGALVDPEWSLQAHRVLTKLSRQFGVVHVHANNHARGIDGPDQLCASVRRHSSSPRPLRHAALRSS